MEAAPRSETAAYPELQAIFSILWREILAALARVMEDAKTWRET